MPRRLQSILAIAAGFMLIVVLAFGADTVLQAVFPREFLPAGNTHNQTLLAACVAYMAIFCALGSYVTARLAPRRPLRHALELGGLGLGLTLIPTILFWRETPDWYHFAILAAILPAAWLGGTLRERQLFSA